MPLPLHRLAGYCVVWVVLGGWSGSSEAVKIQQVRYVHVVSTRTGPDSTISELLIVNKDGKFFADHYHYPHAHIEELLQAVQEGPVPQLDMRRLGVTPNWLEENAARVLRQLKASPDFSKVMKSNDGWSSEDDQQFLDAFLNLERVKALVGIYYQERWKNDFPEMRIVISLENGSAIHVTSTAQHLFMVPWNVAHNDASYRTFNPRISRALVQILPWIFATNRGRLSGDLGELIGRRLLFPGESFSPNFRVRPPDP